MKFAIVLLLVLSGCGKAKDPTINTATVSMADPAVNTVSNGALWVQSALYQCDDVNQPDYNAKLCAEDQPIPRKKIEEAISNINALKEENARLKAEVQDLQTTGLGAMAVDPAGNFQFIHISEMGALKVTIVPEGGTPVTIVDQIPETGAMKIVPSICPIPPNADLNQFVADLTTDCFIIFKATANEKRAAEDAKIK